MATGDAWWVVWANNQPIKGIGVNANVFHGTKAAADHIASTVIDGTVTGPYADKASAEAAVKTAGGKPGGSDQNISVSKPPPGPQQPAKVTNPLDWLSNIGQFFSALTQPNLWLRISKVLLGGTLVVAGLIKLTGADKKVYGLAGAAASKLPGV